MFEELFKNFEKALKRFE